MEKKSSMDVLEECSKYNQLIIYGAGTIANIFYLFLKQNKIENKIFRFVVSKMLNNHRTKYGIQVCELDALEVKEDMLIIVATQKINHREIENRLKSAGYSQYVVIDDQELLDAFYLRLYELPMDDRSVLFMNLSGRGSGGNPKYIAEKMRDYNRGCLKSKRIHLTWAVADKSDENGIPDDIEVVEIGSEEYYKKIACSKVWIDNVRKSGEIKKRKGQIYIQVWHGAAPIKKVERDAQDKLPQSYISNAKRDSKMADMFVSGSEFYTKLYKKSFWYNGEIMKVGLPRQDIFWNPSLARKKVFEYYNLRCDKKLVLYAPTFRCDYNNKVYDLDVNKLLHALEKRFGGKYLCAISKHPDNLDVEYDLKNAENVVYVEKYPDFEEILAAADVLISDYSGCMYDYSFTGRPIFLYQKDIVEYKKDRNFYIPMEELPYIQATTNQELEERIENFDSEVYRKKLKKFMLSMGNYDDGNASEKVVHKIITMME